MKLLNSGDILETIEMLTTEHLDVRTVTMGISLLDCIDPDGRKACEKIYNKITARAARLVPEVERIAAEYGIPIVNKRISVTPIAMLLGAAPNADPVWYAKALDAAAKAVGVNFIGGYGALVHKGFSAGDRRLIEHPARAGRNRPCVFEHQRRFDQIGHQYGRRGPDGPRDPRDGRAHQRQHVYGRRQAGRVLQRAGRQPLHGRGVPRPRRTGLRAACGRFRPRRGARRAGQAAQGRADGRSGRAGQAHGVQDHAAGPAGGQPGQRAPGRRRGIIDLSLAPTPAIGDSVANILEEMGLESCGCCGTTACLALLNDAVKKAASWPPTMWAAFRARSSRFRRTTA